MVIEYEGKANETYLRQKLEWVKFRLRILDEIEDRLTEMRSIAVMAENTSLDETARSELSNRMRTLEKEVKELDGKSKIFWMDNQ